MNHLVEVRESFDFDPYTVIKSLQGKTFETKQALIKGLEEAGVGEDKLWLIRVYDFTDAADAINAGELDAVAFIQLGEEMDATNRLVHF